MIEEGRRRESDTEREQSGERSRLPPTEKSAGCFVGVDLNNWISDRTCSQAVKDKEPTPFTEGDKQFLRRV